MFEATTVGVERFTADVLEWHTSKHIPRSELASCVLTAEEVGRDIALQLKAKILAFETSTHEESRTENVGYVVGFVTQHPKTWWDHLKKTLKAWGVDRKWLWFSDRFNYEVYETTDEHRTILTTNIVTHKHYNVCPHVAIPDHKAHFDWLVYGDSSKGPMQGHIIPSPWGRGTQDREDRDA